MSEDFEFEYGASQQTKSYRELVSGHYAVEIISVTPKVGTVGKYAGYQGIEWACKIIAGELEGLRFIITSLLAPEEMRWTTDRIVNAIFPALDKGTKLVPNHFLGCKMEVRMKTRTNAKTGRVSMYADADIVAPYVESGIAGDADAFSPDGPSSVPF